MALTRTELEQLHDGRVRRVDLGADRRAPAPPSRAGWLTADGRVPGRWPLALGVAWVLAHAAVFLTTPPPADPSRPEPVWASVLVLGLMAALGATAAGLARRRRVGLVASVVAAGIALTGTVLCPVSDHHEVVGAWWYLHLAGFGALALASLQALRRSATT